MTLEQRLRNTTKRWMDEVWRKRNLSSLNELHAPEFQDRSPAGRGTDLASYSAGIEDLFTAFPDFSTTTEDILVDVSAHKTAVRWRASGTHEGAFMGVAPTHRRITFTGIEILRIEEEQIVERWGEWDALDILAQLKG